MGFIYDDISSMEMRLRARLTSWQVLGNLRNFTSAIPGKYGVADFGADLDAREIRVSCNIFPRQNFKDLVNVLDDIALWLNPLDGLRQLVFDEVPDRYYMARLREAVDCERVIRSAGRFELLFFCPDPFAYAIEDEEFIITEVGTHTVTRSLGNIASAPVLELKGEILKSSNRFISISLNDTEIKIVNALLSSDEVLIIDMEKMTSYITDANGFVLRNALPYLEKLDFPSLNEGDNTIQIAATGSAFSELKIKARSRWR